jgi:hypothetical protein
MWESIKDAIGNLAGLLTFLGGILGGILLAQHTAKLQRRNWQIQELMKTYAELFTVGDEALRLCNTIAMFLDNLGAQMGDSCLAQARETDPDVRKEYDRIQSIRQDFGAKEDLRFRRLLTQCWMLEGQTRIRTQLKEFEKEYLICKVGLDLRHSKLVGQRKQACADMVQKRVSPDALFHSLERLQIAVAKQHFHGRKCKDYAKQ